MTLVRHLTAFLLLLTFAASPARAFDASDRHIEPTERVGAVTETSSEADLVVIFGTAAVTRTTGGEGQEEETVLFSGTPDEIRIEWKSALRSPRRIVIDGEAWKTSEGLSVGLPMEKLESINGGPFDVTGANWDRPVRVVSWKGGRLPPRLQVDLGPEGSEATLPKKLRSHRIFFESTHPVFRKANLVVKRLIIEW